MTTRLSGSTLSGVSLHLYAPDTLVSVPSRLLDRCLLVLTRGPDSVKASGWEGRPLAICGGCQ